LSAATEGYEGRVQQPEQGRRCLPTGRADAHTHEAE